MSEHLMWTAVIRSKPLEAIDASTAAQLIRSAVGGASATPLFAAAVGHRAPPCATVLAMAFALHQRGAWLLRFRLLRPP